MIIGYWHSYRVALPGRHGATSACTALLVTLAACGGEGAGSGGAVIRDSAGIQIVENTAPSWAEGEGWELSKTPVLSIGELEGDPRYQLYEAYDARRLSDGRIVVANAGSSELRFYDGKGKFKGAAGRKGGGPGEFQGLADVWVLADDSLLAYDARNDRISFFDPSGGFVRSFQLQTLTGGKSSPSLVAPFADGSLLIRARTMFFSPHTEGGLRRDSILYLRCDPEGALIDSMGWFPGPEWYVKSEQGSMTASTRAFGRAPVAAAFADAFYFGASDIYEIARYDASGELQRLIRKTQQNVSVTAEDIERWKVEHFREEDENTRIFWERMFADMPFPETMPAYERLIVDDEGSLWVEEYRRPGDEQPRWTVFDPQGVLLGEVETPPGLQVYQIGSDFVLGRWTDELDVEHVQLYKLKGR
ncbi:MAG: hypothetical protein GTO46_09275 [Gemmatimonadetes bacterium]|nr:hypothetical protein [Gemmatimonadota bacterium]NIO31806.1 hypothetical protein [Gemmatimonadota bacterium]